MLTPCVNPVTAGKKTANVAQKGRASGGACPIGLQQRFVPMGDRAYGERHQRGRETRHYDILEPRREIRAHPREHAQRNDCCGGDAVQDERAAVGHERRCRFGETDAVEADRHGLSQKYDDADSSAEAQAERARNEVVVATALHPQICRDRRNRQGREQRNTIGNGDHGERPHQPGLADDEAEPQEQDDAEYRQDARREHAGKGAQSRVIGR